MEPAPTPPDLAYRFGLVVLGLCQVVANHVNRDCSNEPYIARIYFSLRRRLKRFERLFARAQAELVLSAIHDGETPGAGTAAAPPVPPVVDPAAVDPAGAGRPSSKAAAEMSGGAAKKMRKPYERLPRKRAWMLDMMPYQASLYWYRLDDLLRDPEMVAFLARSRKARRLLRPLWYGLCLDPLPACLREPPPETIPSEIRSAATKPVPDEIVADVAPRGKRRPSAASHSARNSGWRIAARGLARRAPPRSVG